MDSNTALTLQSTIKLQAKAIAIQAETIAELMQKVGLKPVNLFSSSVCMSADDWEGKKFPHFQKKNVRVLLTLVRLQVMLPLLQIHR